MVIEHEALRHQWYVVADADAISDAPVRVTLLGDDYVVWRTPDGQAVAAPDRCPHREAPLSAGTVEDGCLVCPYHGWTFGDGGRCVLVPSSGPDRPVPPTAHLRNVSSQERYGLIWICPGEPAADLPSMRYDDDPAYRRINAGVEVWSVNALRMVDNFMDISHFGWVHLATFGRPEIQVVPKIDLRELDDGYYGYEFEVEAGNTAEAGTVASGTTGETVHRRMTTGFCLPLTVRSTIHYASGLDHVLLLCSTPIDDERSYFTFVVWRNDDFSVPGEEIIAFDRAIGREDQVMLEKIPGELPLDQQATVSVQSDKPSVEWRRRFVELLSAG